MQAVKQWLVLSALALPTPLLAQAPTRDALIGAWVRTTPWTTNSGKSMTEIDSLTLWVDSTWRLQIVGEMGVQDGSGQGEGTSGCAWSVSGDSLWFGPPASPKGAYGKTLVTGKLPANATLRGDELTIQVPHHPKDTSPKVFKRAGPPGPESSSSKRCKE